MNGVFKAMLVYFSPEIFKKRQSGFSDNA